MVFAVPALLACFIAFVRSEKRWWPVALVLVLAALTYHQDRHGLYSQQSGHLANSQKESAKLDTILDACGYDSYVFAGGFPIFALAKHSPIGPVFSPYFHDYLGFDHPLYKETWDRIRQKGMVFVEPKVPSKEPDPVPPDIRALFGTTVPSCAAGFATPDGFVVKYRIPPGR